jgi:hypothetical protein
MPQAVGILSCYSKQSHICTDNNGTRTLQASLPPNRRSLHGGLRVKFMEVHVYTFLILIGWDNFLRLIFFRILLLNFQFLFLFSTNEENFLCINY